MNTVWCVWTERGEYEDFSRDLRGVFATQALAEEHAQHLRDEDGPDFCEVTSEPVLAEVPADVPYIEWSAHINPDGTEDPETIKRGERWRTFSNEITTMKSRLDPWSGRHKPDLYIEVVGCDPAAVEAEYKRLLTDARARLADRRVT